METITFTITATSTGFASFLQAFWQTEANEVRLASDGRVLSQFLAGAPQGRDNAILHSHLRGYIALWDVDRTEAVAVGFKWTQIADRLRVTLECYEPVAKDYFRKLLDEIHRTWPESQAEIDAYLKGPGGEPDQGRENADDREAAGRRYGAHGGTLDRVKEAQDLIKNGEYKTTACKRAGIDIRTFDRYVIDITCPDEE